MLFLHLVSPRDVSLHISQNNSVTESKQTVMSGMGPDRLTIVLYLYVEEEKGRKFVFGVGVLEQWVCLETMSEGLETALGSPPV